MRLHVGQGLDLIDKTLDEARRLGLTVVVQFENRDHCTPEKVREAVTRLKGGARYWEIINEPNFSMNPQQYVELLKQVCPIIKGIDPSAQIMGPTVCGINLAWYEEVFQAGGGPLLDIISIHDYEGNESIDPGHWRFKIGELRKLMARYQLGNKPIWQTERAICGVRAKTFLGGVQAVRIGLQRDVLETLGIPSEHNLHYYVNQSGYGAVPTYVWSSSGPHPAALALRTREAARNCLAWEDIEDDAETVGQLDEAQKRLMARNLGRAKMDLKEALWRAYRRLYLLGKDNTLREIDLGQITSSMATSLVELYLIELTRSDEITAGVGPSKLVKYWPPALREWSTEGVRDAFFSSPQLPRLLQADAVKRAIADGVSQGAFGYARKNDQGGLVLERFRESLADAEVEISDDVFLLKCEDAERMLEPPRLARLAVRPENAALKPGEQASFSCVAQDQRGQPFALPPIEWAATGGTVTPEGLFTAGQSTGLFTVHAKAEGIEAIAEVRVTKDGPPPPPPGKQMIRWSGEVPPQKWMSLYMKVLSRFASSPELKLTVSFEAPADDEQARAKADEAKAGLRELGLDDDVTLT